MKLLTIAATVALLLITPCTYSLDVQELKDKIENYQPKPIGNQERAQILNEALRMAVDVRLASEAAGEPVYNTIPEDLIKEYQNNAEELDRHFFGQVVQSVRHKDTIPWVIANASKHCPEEELFDLLRNITNRTGSDEGKLLLIKTTIDLIEKYPANAIDHVLDYPVADYFDTETVQYLIAKLKSLPDRRRLDVETYFIVSMINNAYPSSVFARYHLVVAKEIRGEAFKIFKQFNIENDKKLKFVNFYFTHYDALSSKWQEIGLNNRGVILLNYLGKVTEINFDPDSLTEVEKETMVRTLMSDLRFGDLDSIKSALYRYPSLGFESEDFKEEALKVFRSRSRDIRALGSSFFNLHDFPLSATVEDLFYVALFSHDDSLRSKAIKSIVQQDSDYLERLTDFFADEDELLRYYARETYRLYLNIRYQYAPPAEKLQLLEKANEFK